MWRMFRAGILGVLLGVAGGIIFGQVSYVKNYRDKADRGIMADAVMYNYESDESDRKIRIQVDYSGQTDSEKDRDELESYVGNSVMKQVSNWLGDNYNSKMSYIDVRHSLVMAMGQINSIASQAAETWGVDAEANSGFSYEFFPAAGEDCPAGFYETLCIDLNDR